MLRRFAFALACVLTASQTAQAQTAARLEGEVSNSKGETVAKARVKVTSPALDGFEEKLTASRKGRFGLQVDDAGVPYAVHIEAEGYAPWEGEIRLDPEKPVRHTFILRTEAEAAAGQAVADAEQAAQEEALRKSRAIDVHNEGLERMRGGDLPGAGEKMREALELNPEQAPSHRVLAQIYLEQDQVAEAVTAAQRAVELDPTPEALAVLYDAQSQAGDEAGAEAALSSLEGAGGQAAAVRLYNIGAAKIQEGDMQKAAALFGRAVSADPQLTAAHYGLAAASLNLGHFDAAVRSARKALELEPEYAPAMRVLYSAQLAGGDRAGALETLGAMAEADPQGSTAALTKAGRDIFESGDTETAKQIFQKVLSGSPDEPTATYMLGLIALNQGRLADAKTLLTRFLEVAPDHPEAGGAREMLSQL